MFSKIFGVLREEIFLQCSLNYLLYNKIGGTKKDKSDLKKLQHIHKK